MAKRLVIGDRVYTFIVGDLIIIYDTSIAIDDIMLVTTQIKTYSALRRTIVLPDDSTGVDWTHKDASLSYPYRYVDTEPKLDVMNVMRQYGSICHPVNNPPAETPQPIENILNHVIYDCIY